MSFPTFVSLSSLLFENNYFLILLVFEDFGSYRCTFNGGGAKSRLSIIYNHQYLIKFYLITFVCVGETIHEKFITFLNCELTTLCLNCSFHG